MCANVRKKTLQIKIVKNMESMQQNLAQLQVSLCIYDNDISI